MGPSIILCRSQGNYASPLMQHVKGLGELTDMTQKLMTIIEEDTNHA